jgi:uncharacterized protein
MTDRIAIVSTANGSRYLQQLCKHWSHNLAVSFTPEHGVVTFPKEMRGELFASEGRIEMTARADALEVRVSGADEAHVARLKEVAARHLDRFAFREAPLRFDWREPAAGA